MARPRTVGDVIDQITKYVAEFRAYAAQPVLPGEFRLSEMREKSLKFTLLQITEATTRLPQAQQDKAPDIPWRQIVDMGNRLRHDYDDLAIEYIENLIANQDLDNLLDALTLMDPDAPAERQQRPAR